ncbi:hypothetical protein OQA88_9892 [Cercophora sp. LCS_1]
MSQPPPHPTLINLPQPPSQPDTPSEIPGTPTSTTTSLSALSTTAIKDGHRGHPAHPHRGHQHNLSTNSLEAERADRISRLTGLSSALRFPSHNGGGGPPLPANANNPNAHNQTTPTTTTFPYPAPVYFDAAGQPVAATKMSTVGSASATDPTETGDDGSRRDDDERSMDTNDQTEIEMGDSISAAGTGGYIRDDGDDDAVMDDDLAARSVGGFDMDRMSDDDGSASLVAFGEGALSTVSGPIYHRRPLPEGGGWPTAWGGLERSGSGLSEMVRERGMMRDGGGETPVSMSAVQERREALMVDGVSLDGVNATALVPTRDDDVFVDTSTREPVPVIMQQPISAIRETQQPGSHQQLQQQAQAQAQAQARAVAGNATRETAERIIRERLDDGEGRVGNTAMGSPKGNERLGRFYFEDRR